MRAKASIIASTLTLLFSCRDATLPLSEQCDAGYTDACFEAGLIAPTSRERDHLMNRGAHDDPACHWQVRDAGGFAWTDVEPADAQFALHKYGVMCSRGYAGACFEVGNWLLFDFASPAAAVAPYQMACTASFEDACKRVEIARTLAAAPPTNKPPPSWWN